MDTQCLNRVQACFKVDLHPSKLHNVEAGVHEHLNNVLFRYQDDLQGFVMAYEGVKIVTKNASIHPYFPLVHLEVRAQVLLFKPSVGCMLVGRVIKVAADFIGLLVLGIFNASIASDSIRSELKCNLREQVWVSKKHPDHQITLGTEVQFQVIKLQEQAVFFGIFGALTDKNTGAIEYLVKKGRLTASMAAATDAQNDPENSKRKKKAAGSDDKDCDRGKKKKDKKDRTRNKEQHQNDAGLPNGGAEPSQHAKQNGKLGNLKRQREGEEPTPAKRKKKQKAEG